MKKSDLTQFEFFIMGSTLVLGAIMQSNLVTVLLANESWLTGILGLAFFAPMIFVYSALANRYPGKSLFSILVEVFGAPIGKAVGWAYLFLFANVLSVNMFQMASISNEAFSLGTPPIAIALLFMAAASYASMKGVSVFARSAVIIVIIGTAAVMVDLGFGVASGDLKNILPLFQKPPMAYAQAALTAVAIPFGETFMLMMFMPYSKLHFSVKSLYFQIGVFVAFLITVIHLRETLELGPVISYLANPTAEAIKIISFGNAFARLESVFIVLYNSLSFIKICFLFLCVSYGFAELAQIEGGSRCPFVIGMILSVYSVNVVYQAMDLSYYVPNVFVLIEAFMFCVMPAIAAGVSTALDSIQHSGKEKLKGQK